MRTEHAVYRGTSPIRNRTPPLDHLRPLGTGLLQGLGRKRFLMSEVPLHEGRHPSLGCGVQWQNSKSYRGSAITRSHS